MRQPQRDRSVAVLEVVCVLVVLAAVIALVIWIVTSAGGGVLNQG